MKAMILAAGEGTRLRPLTLTLPKPMVPVANVPLLVRTIRLLATHGIREIAINLFYKSEVIVEVLGDGSSLGVSLHYSPEEALMGTAGGVKRMEAFLNETFLVLYGDNLYEADFGPLIEKHVANQASATIATFTTPNPTACGLVVTDEVGRVTRFQEKPPASEVFTDQANAGVYVLEPSVLAYISADIVYDFGRDVFPAMLAAHDRVQAFPLQGYLQDTGTVPNYRQANWDALTGATGGAPEGKDGLLLGEGVTISPTAMLSGRNVLGAETSVGAGAVLTETICWEHCHIGYRAQLRNVILGFGVTIGDDAIIGNGAILAEGVQVEAGAVVPENARIGPDEVIS